jgi:membrane dipeptidase
MRKVSIGLFSLVLVASCAPKKEAHAKEETLEAKAARIHEAVITIDTHDDINVANFTDSINYTQRLNTQVNLPKMSEGQLDVAWLIVYTGQGELTSEGYAAAEENAMSKFEAIKRLTNTYAPDQIALATNSTEVRSAIADGKMVAMIGVENAYPMGEDLSNFEKYHALGARYVSLSHNGHSQFSDSNTGEADGFLHNGLSELGKKAVIEMNRLGIMIDVSHPSKEAMRQMIELSKAPLIASHSSARALCDHSRNLDDEQLMWLKENGGLVQTVAFSSYVNTEKHNARNAYMSALQKSLAEEKGLKWYERSELRALSAEEREAFTAYAYDINEAANEAAANDAEAPAGVAVADFVDHIDYMVDLIGVDHVGISSDFDGGGGITGWSDASETQNVTLELVKRGYSEEDIAKLWGENLLRVLDEVEAVSANWTIN